MPTDSAHTTIAADSPKGRRRILIHHSGSTGDQPLVKHLLAHLKPLESSADRSQDRVQPHGRIGVQIESAADVPEVVLLLLSADYLGAISGRGAGLADIPHRDRTRGLRVIPILIRACAWELEPSLSALQPLPRDRRPVASLPENERDGALAELAREIVRTCSEDWGGADGTLPPVELAEAIAREPEKPSETDLIRVRLYNNSACEEWVLNVAPSLRLLQLNGELLAQMRSRPWRSPDVPMPDFSYTLRYYTEKAPSVPLDKHLTVGELAKRNADERPLTLHVSWSREYLGNR